MLDDIKVSNFIKYKRFLNELIGKDETDKLIDILGGQEKIMNASFGMTADSGCAYPGAFVCNCISIAEYGKKINKTLPEYMQVQEREIYKVALLQHIGKILMYVENENDWEVKNRGILYRFSDQDTALRCGERSIFALMQANVNITEKEFEAIRIMDKAKDDDSYSKFYSNTLSFVIRQANEMVSLVNKISTTLNKI